MSEVLDRRRRNALVMAIHRAIVDTFEDGDWRSLGFQTDTLDWVESHHRLLRSMSFGDPDYSGHALEAVTRMLNVDVENLGVMLEIPKIVIWLQANSPSLYAEFCGGDEHPDPNIDPALAIHEFLWRGAADAGRTKDFQEQHHDDMLEVLRQTADEQLPGRPSVIITQSLRDAGCDMTIDWSRGAKFGLQLKSHYDISEPTFTSKTVAQIQYSKQHGLRRLYVLLAGDLTDRSQREKVRGLSASISQMNDPYVRAVCPERVWTLLFGQEEVT